MKRQISGDTGVAGDPEKAKRRKIEGSEKTPKAAVEDVLMDENLLFEVLKHVDARTLAWAACVSKRWNRTAQDERLWELMCNKDGSRSHYQRQQQFRAVVLALGGFRRLYSLHLWPLVKISSSPSPPPPPSSTWPCLPAPPPPQAKSAPRREKRLGKDEMNLSLSLFSIQYFAKMNFSNRNKKT